MFVYIYIYAYTSTSTYMTGDIAYCAPTSSGYGHELFIDAHKYVNRQIYE